MQSQGPSAAKPRIANVLAANVAAGVAASGGQVATAASPSSAELAAQIEKLPAKQPDEAIPVMQALVKGAPTVVAELVKMVGQTFGDPKGVKATYALHGLVHYVSRAGAAEERKMVAEALAKQLAAPHSADLKSFLCQQLQWCGRREEVPALAPLLADEKLCEPAAQALVSIGGPAAAAALRAALSTAKGKQRMTIINSLGRLQDAEVAAEIRKLLSDADADLRAVAWYAAARAGDAAAAEHLLKIVAGEPSYERNQAFDACLRLTQRLAELGNAAEGERILRQLQARCKAPDETHFRSAILEGLAKVLGVKALPDALAALKSENLKERMAAGRIALDLAQALKKDHPAEADRLLAAILEETTEEAVRQRAQQLLGRAVK
jgi:HEAT repeat protein